MIEPFSIRSDEILVVALVLALLSALFPVVMSKLPGRPQPPSVGDSWANAATSKLRVLGRVPVNGAWIANSKSTLLELMVGLLGMVNVARLSGMVTTIWPDVVPSVGVYV